MKINRRNVLKGTGAIAASAVAGTFGTRAAYASDTIKIGFVSPQSGPLSIFAEPDQFAIDQVMKATGGQIEAGGKTYAIEFVVKDSQSNPNRAAEVANELINSDQVNLLLATATPETTNPAASAAELAEVPCLTNDTPWQPHFFGRGGDPRDGWCGRSARAAPTGQRRGRVVVGARRRDECERRDERDHDGA